MRTNTILRRILDTCTIELSVNDYKEMQAIVIHNETRELFIETGENPTDLYNKIWRIVKAKYKNV